MRGDSLTIADAAENGVISLQVASVAGVRHYSFSLGEAWSIQDMQAVLDACWWFEREGQGWKLTADRPIDEIADWIFDVTRRFDSPEQPDDSLRDAKDAIESNQAVGSLVPSITWMEVAWLDLFLREAVADQIRSAEGTFVASDLWSDAEWVIKLDATRRGLIDEFLASRRPVKARMASSVSTRSSSHRTAI
ncbi:MAG: hypothetical protein AAFV88_17615 [Planctomycetota bacterium]